MLISRYLVIVAIPPNKEICKKEKNEMFKRKNMWLPGQEIFLIGS